MTRCPDCQGPVPDIDGPAHAYLGASPGCWKLYGEVLAKEYSDPAYMKVHRLTVDTYAVQHPGKPEPRAIQSINAHLLALYLILVRNCEPGFATQRLGAAIQRNKGRLTWLESPRAAYPITVADVAKARGPLEHAAIVERWAQVTWETWRAHHAVIAALAAEVL